MQNKVKLGSLLISLGLITPEQLKEALEIQPFRQAPIGQILVEQGYVSKDALVEALEDLGDVGNTVQIIANSYGITPNVDLDTRHVMDNLVSAALTQIGSHHIDMLEEGAVTAENTRPVVGLTNQILEQSVRAFASDIHVEPRKDDVQIRHRVDGKLLEIMRLPKALQAAVIARIKIMGEMDIVEYRMPQDGRISITVDERPIDLRVSILPTYHGQRVVLRILDKRVALRNLPELGFSEHNLQLFQRMITKPHGLILVTGPTGSGKTTTLYAAINRIKDIANNIMTCEDPVEYDLEGINQSHVNEKVGLTFAAQLRAILRQDPDVILVGEIRDKETAVTAIRAALTGHLVLSTLHCNDAPGAIPRLTDMGIEPFLLSTVLIGVMAQRLVRVLCEECKTTYEPTPEEMLPIHALFGHDEPALFGPKGCPKCNRTGYSGRTGIHEILPVVPEVQRAIAAGEPLETIREIGKQHGFRPMYADACERVVAGKTDLNEIKRHVFLETTSLPRVLRLKDAA